MKIQIDTTNKTLKIEENVKLSKFMDWVKKLLPNNEWKEFTLETNTTIIGWQNPIYIDRYVEPLKPYYPWYRGYDEWNKFYCSADNKGMGDTNINMSNSLKSSKSSLPDELQELKLQSGVYNVEVK